MTDLFANDNATGHDVVLPFMIESTHIRGRHVKLEKSLNEVLTQHQYPRVVSQLLGELLAMAALIGNTLKLDGVVSIQLHGARPLRLLVADYSSEGHIRAYAKWYDEDTEWLYQQVEYDFQKLVGQGTLMIAIEHRHWRERYQGIVALDKPTLAECMRAYFLQSEQLDACITLACRYVPHNGSGHWIAAGMMIQRLPEEGGKRLELVFDKDNDEVEDSDDIRAMYVEPNDWEHASVLFKTLTDDELTDSALPAEKLIFRLYHEDGVRFFAPQAIVAQCRCSRDKITQVIKTLSLEEIEGLYIEDVIRVRCEFCSKEEAFSRSEVLTVLGNAESP